MESAFVFVKVEKDEPADQQVSSSSLESPGVDANRNGDTNSLMMNPLEDPLGVKEEVEKEEVMDVKVETKEEPFDDGSTASLLPSSKPQAVSGSGSMTKQPPKTLKKRLALPSRRMATDFVPAYKARRPNFTERELLTMVEEVHKRHHIIMGKLDKNVTARVKHLAWKEIAQAVSAVGRAYRFPDELRRKFKDLRSAVKKKAMQQTSYVEGTDGGPAQRSHYTKVEQAILTVLTPSGYAVLPIPESEDVPLAVTTAEPPVPPPASAALLTDTSTSMEPIVLSSPQTPASVIISGDVRAPVNSQKPPTTQPGVEVRQSCLPITSPIGSEGAGPSLPTPLPTQTSNTVPAGLLQATRVIPEVVQGQRDIRDLLAQLVEGQREGLRLQAAALEVQKAAVETQKAAVETQKAAVEAQQVTAEAQKRVSVAMLALAQSVAGKKKD